MGSKAMGSRTTDFQDESFNHNLKNKQAFSTLKNQMEAFSKDGLLFYDKNGARLDRRIKIEFSWHKSIPASYASLCQLAGRVNDSIDGVGSCYMVTVNGVNCILTCAHNLVSKSALTGKFLIHKCGYIYQMRQGENAWLKLWKLEMNKIYIHPKYSGETSCGFDFAVCPIITEKHKFDARVDCSKVIIDCQWSSVDPADIKVGYEIEVGGYPGEKAGYPHYHSGKIMHIKNTEKGGCILFYEVDTTPGNSGSPIWITDKRFFDDHKNKNKVEKGVTKWMIGVHTGHSAVDMLNYGILTTPAMGKWIKGRIR